MRLLNNTAVVRNDQTMQLNQALSTLNKNIEQLNKSVGAPPQIDERFAGPNAIQQQGYMRPTTVKQGSIKYFSIDTCNINVLNQ